MNLENIWHEFLKIVSEEVGSRFVETWLKAVIFSNWDGNLKIVYLKAPNTFVRDWINGNHIHLFKIHLGRLLNEKDITIMFLNQTKTDIQITPAISLNSNNQIPDLKTNNQNLPEVIKKCEIKGRINQNFTFDTFVVGSNNSLAYAAAQAVAEKPGILYNPLFIYGNSGLGKTHLLHAVANYVKSNFSYQILYQTTDRFINEFINAIRFDKVNAFESRYRNVDLLLVDDIQFISNKEQTQEAFFHIFNALYESKRQIIFSSDSLPKNIGGLAERLRSRLDSGLITDIQFPCLETKIAIIKKKADLHQTILPDEVANIIALQSSTNIRELEGLLIRVMAFSSLTKQPITLELANKVLIKSIDQHAEKKKIDLNFIAHNVAKFFSYTINELKSDKRIKNLNIARQTAMYLMKKYTDNSLADIGMFLRRRDHSTVIHAIERVEEYKILDHNFKKNLEKLENSLA